MDKLLVAILVMLAGVMISNPLSNPIANMQGPYFLMFYGVVIGVTLIVCRFGLKPDETGKLAIPLVPENPDPYEIAYLRGGKVEVIKVVITNLIQKGFLKLSKDGIEPTGNSDIDLNQMDLKLSAIEQDVLAGFTDSKNAREIVKFSGSSIFDQYYQEYQQNLKSEKLFYPDELQANILLFKRLGTLIIWLLGGYKLIVSLSQGHINVGFLLILGFVATTVLWNWCQIPRISHLGWKYLSRLQQTFEQLKQEISTPSEETGSNLLKGIFTKPHQINNSFPLFVALLVALFGIGVLSGTPYKELEQFFKQRSTVSHNNHPSSTSHHAGGCGSSCSGGCSSRYGGGCGGCGGSCGS